jgi:acetolactate decarboxylase
VVSSPKEAHSGQTPFEISASTVQIVGFFSREHQGIFTHHDTFMHLHLLCKSQNLMGHLDAVRFSRMQLLLPK